MKRKGDLGGSIESEIRLQFMFMELSRSKPIAQRGLLIMEENFYINRAGIELVGLVVYSHLIDSLVLA